MRQRDPQTGRLVGDLRYRHGTYSSYVHARCRCDDCRRANAAYFRAYRARKRKEAVA
jgi:hypothetical protein